MAQSTGRKLQETQTRKRFELRNWIIIYLVVLLFLFLAVTRDNFFTFNNVHSIVHGVSFEFFAAIGFTLLIIMGELDMSVGALFGFGGAVMSYFVFTYKLPVGVAIALAMVLALLIGLVAGFLIVHFRLNSMMVTIGVMMAVKGINAYLVNKFGGRQLPLGARSFVTVDIAGIKWSILVMVLLAVILEIFLNKSRHLRQLYYIGHNMETTTLYGLSTARVKCICFGVSAALSAFGGALMTARISHPNVTVGNNLEINVITAAVISGASIFGGRGSVVRTMLGVLFIFTLQNGMTAYGIDTYRQQVILGAILIGAIYLDLRVNRKREG